MFLPFAHLAFSAVLKLLVGRRRTEFAKDVELMVLRVGCANPSVTLPGCIRGSVRQAGRGGGADLTGSNRQGVGEVVA
jgi:hypothetical protein